MHGAGGEGLERRWGAGRVVLAVVSGAAVSKIIMIKGLARDQLIGSLQSIETLKAAVTREYLRLWWTLG